jgi:small subunit ribosomal protein S6
MNILESTWSYGFTYTGAILMCLLSYWTLHCDASPQTLQSLNNFLRRDPRVLRWTVLKLGDRVEDVARQGRKITQTSPPAEDIADL